MGLIFYLLLSVGVTWHRSIPPFLCRPFRVITHGQCTRMDKRDRRNRVYVDHVRLYPQYLLSLVDIENVSRYLLSEILVLDSRDQLLALPEDILMSSSFSE